MNFTNDVHNTPDIKSPTVKSRMTCFELATADGSEETNYKLT